MRDESRGPDRRFRIESEREAFELVERTAGYGATHAASFGGAWLDYIEDHPYVFASFKGDLAEHRGALDPRVRLIRAVRTRAELVAVSESVGRFADAFPVEERSIRVDEEHGRVVLSVTVEDDAGFETALREQFDGVVDAYFSILGRHPNRIGQWTVAADGRTIEAVWMGGGGERDHRLEAEERDGAIHLTASCVREVDIRRAAGGCGPRIHWGSMLEGHERRASVALEEPVGSRRILDDQRDRIHDHPPVKRSRRQRLTEATLGLTVWDWVDTLDWAEGRGCQGPGENGWIRIYATVDDTERLRAAIVEKFGPGFEVEYQAPYDPDEDDP